MRFSIQAISGALLLLASGLPAAHAGEHVYSANNAKWKTECGACHLAYPPQLLPARRNYALPRRAGLSMSMTKCRLGCGRARR